MNKINDKLLAFRAFWLILGLAFAVGGFFLLGKSHFDDTNKHMTSEIRSSIVLAGERTATNTKAIEELKADIKDLRKEMGHGFDKLEALIREGR